MIGYCDKIFVYSFFLDVNREYTVSYLTFSHCFISFVLLLLTRRRCVVISSMIQSTYLGNRFWFAYGLLWIYFVFNKKMYLQRFPGLYLQNTGHALCFSFVTYTPQSKEQMIACGDLMEHEEYFNPVIFDFLLFVSEGILGWPIADLFPIGYDDVSIVAARQRGTGVQNEYLIRIKQDHWNESMDSALTRLRTLMSDQSWRGRPIDNL